MDSTVAYDWFVALATFFTALFILERAADVFVDSTAAVSKRLGIPTILVALLTAGAEWEELAVVVASLAQGHRELALGNIVGSNIANILGSFSLGLLFSRPSAGPVGMDSSSRIYTVLLVGLSAVVAGLSQIEGGRGMGKTTGGVLVGVFVLYIAGVAYAIYSHVMDAPEGSDSDSDSDSDEEEAAGEYPSLPHVLPTQSPFAVPSSSTPLLTPTARPRRSTTSHIAFLILSTLFLALSGTLLSSSCSSFATLLALDPNSIGLTLLSISTTLPEKFVAVYAGARGQNGVLVANTVGSNIFLLSLVLGICLVWQPQEGGEGVGRIDAAMMLLSAIGLLAVVWTGWMKRWVGGIMMGAYVAYIVQVCLR
jgi:Ca2+/Na+ antiporter